VPRMGLSSGALGGTITMPQFLGTAVAAVACMRLGRQLPGYVTMGSLRAYSFLSWNSLKLFGDQNHFIFCTKQALNVTCHSKLGTERTGPNAETAEAIACRVVGKV
jgi:hypothetical protein